MIKSIRVEKTPDGAESAVIVFDDGAQEMIGEPQQRPPDDAMALIVRAEAVLERLRELREPRNGSPEPTVGDANEAFEQARELEGDLFRFIQACERVSAG